MKVIVLGVLLLQILDSHSFIIPDELPSILSVIYSNIPTIKKGTDSRLGWGFKLGDRADFQVLVELGPQTNTQPLANQGDSNASKRDAINNLANMLYALRQQEKKQKAQEKEDAVSSNSDGAKWLKDWSKTMNKNQENEALPLQPRPGLAIGEIDAKSVIPDDSGEVTQEQKKERKKAEKIKIAVVTERPKTAISEDDASSAS